MAVQHLDTTLQKSLNRICEHKVPGTVVNVTFEVFIYKSNSYYSLILSHNFVRFLKVSLFQVIKSWCDKYFPLKNMVFMVLNSGKISQISFVIVKMAEKRDISVNQFVTDEGHVIWVVQTLHFREKIIY